MTKTLPTGLIQPKDINTTDHFFDLTGRMESELSARAFVTVMQDRDQGWEPIARVELERLWNDRRAKGGNSKPESFWFNGLIEQGFVLHDEANDSFQITHEFVTLIYAKFPVINDPLPAL